MAEEVGSGYVSLLPSMRGFSKLLKAGLKKELAKVRGQGIEVPVTPVLDQKLLNESLKANRKPLRVPVQLDPIKDSPGGKVRPVKVPVEIDRDAFHKSLTGLGKDSRSTIHQRVEIDTDKDFLRSQLANSAREAGSSAAGIFSNSFGVSLPLLIAGVVAAALASPLIAAATGALLLSGAALGAVFFGAFLLKGDEDLKKGVTKLFDDVKKTLADAAKPLKGPFLEAIGIIGKAFKDITPDIKVFFADIAKSGGIQDLARGVAGLFKSFVDTGALKKLGEAIGPILTQIGGALPDIGNAVSQFIISITKPEVIEFVGKLLRGVADLIRFIGGAIGWLAGFANVVIALFKGMWGGLKAIWQVATDVWSGLKLVGNAVVGALTANMDKVRPLYELLKKIFGGLVGNITEIPKKITTALSGAKTLLLQAGKNIVQGLIDGIRNKLGALSTIASQMAGTVRSFLPFSPAKQGPLSGSGNPYHSGQVIAGDLAAGMTSQMPTVHSAAGQLAGAVGFGSSHAAAAAPADPPTVLLPGDRVAAALLELMKEGIRVRNGGNVNLALGS